MAPPGRADAPAARPSTTQAWAGANASGALLLKAVISGLIIATALEAARRSPSLGGLILSLPLVSVITFFWLWRETGDKERIAQLSTGVFWFFLPTLPMFLIFPALLRGGMAFWPALSLALAVTASLYVGMSWVAPLVELRP
jgi:hypothetical protein